MSEVAIRPVRDQDLDAIFEMMRDPVSVHMAAFTADDPDDRAAFDAHMARVMGAAENRFCVIVRDDQVVGTVGSYPSAGLTEVTYWVDRRWWGQGMASRALALLLAEIPERPLRARAASDSLGSLRVLHKAGFRPVGTEVAFAPGRSREIEETILALA